MATTRYAGLTALVLVPGLVRRAFPAILWYASEPAYPFDTPLPLVEYVRAHFRPVARAADKVIYAPAPAP